MIDSKRLSELVMIDDSPADDMSGLWSLRGTEEELDEVLRLSRLGLWAEKHGIMAVKQARGFMDQVHFEYSVGIYGAPSARRSVSEAVAALPKEKE